MKERSFYCEDCGKPVSLRSEKCPSCGKQFDAVKCPVCEFLGSATVFSDGCPSCGYLSSSNKIKGGGLVEVSLEEGTKGAQLPDELPPKPAPKKRSLPGWAYTLISVVLLGFLVILLVLYLQLD
ncbi:MAG: hypothetical protein CMN78_05415 [Spirochaetales bacterium]|nr:hypothetical protein [Spirochaetales bacterium]